MTSASGCIILVSVDEYGIVLMRSVLMSKKIARRASSADRLTVSLAPGQRAALESVADKNSVKLAFVVRRALAEFIETHRDKQIPLSFPEL